MRWISPQIKVLLSRVHRLKHLRKSKPFQVLPRTLRQQEFRDNYSAIHTTLSPVWLLDKNFDISKYPATSRNCVKNHTLKTSWTVFWQFRGEPGMWGEGGARKPRNLIDEWRKALVLGHLSARDSMKGTLREGSVTGEPERWGFWEICKMPCKRASLFIVALLGNLEGARLPGLLTEKKSISGFFSWTLGPLRF